MIPWLIMQAKIVCLKHGRLDFDDVIIKNGIPICRKCQSVLEFGKIRPRKVEGAEKKKRRRSRKKK